MTEDELLAALRVKRADPTTRIDMDTFRTPPLYQVATDGAISDAERRLGFPFPPLLKRVYAEVGNGGFGPGAGTLGLEGGYASADGRVLPAEYEYFRAY